MKSVFRRILLFLLFSAVSAEAANIAATLDTDDGSSAFVFKSASGIEQALIDSEGNAVFKGGLRLDAGGVECGTSEMLIVDGRIGIGTDNPGSMLHISNPTGAMTINIEDSGAGSLNDANPSINFRGFDTDLGYVGYGSTGNADMAVVNYQNGALRFLTNSTDRMYISGAGNIGVGTLTPGASLEVVKGARFGNTTASPSINEHTVVYSDSGTAWEGGQVFCNMTPGGGITGYKFSSAYSGSSACMRIGLVDTGSPNTYTKDFLYFNSSTGQIGVGTTTPAVAFDVNGRVRGTAVYAIGADDTQRSTSSTAHVFQNNMSCTITVKSGDIVMCQVNGNVWNVGGSNTWIRVELFSGSATNLLNSNYAGNGTSAYESVTTTCMYRADADGDLEFRMKWHVNGATTGYCIYRRIFAWVIGKA